MNFTFSDILSSIALAISLGSLWYTRKKMLFESSLVVAEHCGILKEIAFEQIEQCNNYIEKIELLIKKMDKCNNSEIEILNDYKISMENIKSDLENSSYDLHKTKKDANTIILTHKIVINRQILKKLQKMVEEVNEWVKKCTDCKNQGQTP